MNKKLKLNWKKYATKEKHPFVSEVAIGVSIEIDPDYSYNINQNGEITRFKRKQEGHLEIVL